MTLLNQICSGGRHCIRMRDANENTSSVDLFLQSATFIAARILSNKVFPFLNKKKPAAILP